MRLVRWLPCVVGVSSPPPAPPGPLPCCWPGAVSPGGPPSTSPRVPASPASTSPAWAPRRPANVSARVSVTGSPNRSPSPWGRAAPSSCLPARVSRWTPRRRSRSSPASPSTPSPWLSAWAASAPTPSSGSMPPPCAALWRTGSTRWPTARSRRPSLWRHQTGHHAREQRCRTRRRRLAQAAQHLAAGSEDHRHGRGDRGAGHHRRGGHEVRGRHAHAAALQRADRRRPRCRCSGQERWGGGGLLTRGHRRHAEDLFRGWHPERDLRLHRAARRGRRPDRAGRDPCPERHLEDRRFRYRGRRRRAPSTSPPPRARSSTRRPCPRACSRRGPPPPTSPGGPWPCRWSWPSRR